MQEKIEKIIYNWVKKNFGEPEANDPSWSIEELAKELESHFHELYWQQELEYIKQDVEQYVKGKHKLSPGQIYNIADKIRESDWYCSIAGEDIEYYIGQELKTY